MFVFKPRNSHIAENYSDEAKDPWIIKFSWLALNDFNKVSEIHLKLYMRRLKYDCTVGGVTRCLPGKDDLELKAKHGGKGFFHAQMGPSMESKMITLALSCAVKEWRDRYRHHHKGASDKNCYVWSYASKSFLHEWIVLTWFQIGMSCFSRSKWTKDSLKAKALQKEIARPNSNPLQKYDRVLLKLGDGSGKKEH